MEPERTTTIGEGESLMTERPFHIYLSLVLGQSEQLGLRWFWRTMNAVERTMAKLRIWAAACRGFPRADNIMAAVDVKDARERVGAGRIGDADSQGSEETGFPFDVASW
jgi:hypothetical protein